MKKITNACCASAMAVLPLISTATEAAEAIFFQSSSIVGVGKNIHVTRVPVRDNAGRIQYHDILIPFDVDGSGNLFPGTPEISLSPRLVVGSFNAGTYIGPSGYRYTVGGPGPAPAGRTSWSLTTGSISFHVSWITGPIKGHPNEAQLRTAGINYSGYSWGTVGSSQIGSFRSGNIIGAVQTGNQLVLHNFGSDNIEDTSLVFTLCATPSC